MTKQTQQEQIESYQRLKLLKASVEQVIEQKYRLKLMNIYKEASIYKDTISKNWADYVTFLRGTSQWPARRPSYKVSALINFLVENIERKTALLTDAKPIPKVIPRSDQFQDTADVINDLISMIFEENSFGQASADLIDNAQVFGSGFMGTPFDKSGDNGRGVVNVASYDPRAAYFDPLVTKSCLLHEGEYFILEDIWALEKAKDIYPKRADLFKADVGLSRYRSNTTKSTWGSMVSRVFKTQSQEMTLSEIPRVYIREFYIKDRSGNFRKNCRKSVMIGEVIADDGDNPYNDGEFPVDMLTWHVDFNSGWGWGDVELLKNPQELSNKIMAIIMENITLMSNAIWVGDADALAKEDWKKLNNAPGTYVKKHPGRELRREPGVPLPEYVLTALDGVGVSAEKISGMVDVMRGIRTGQVSSGVGIESLQMMAQALIRLRARALETVYARVGRKLTSRIFQFYEPKRIFEILNARKTNRPVEAIVSELIKPISKRRKDAWTDIIFRIEPGSSLALAQTQKRIESMQLHKLGIIDDEAVLDDLEYPHRTKVLERVRKKRQDEANKEIPPREGPGSQGSQFPNQIGGSPAGRV